MKTIVKCCKCGGPAEIEVPDNTAINTAEFERSTRDVECDECFYKDDED